MTDTTDEIPETHDGTITPTESILTPYRGRAVIEAGVTIANASGGLHDAVQIDPIELDIGARVHVVLECVVRPPQYEPVSKDNLRGPLKLVNRLRAEDATFVDADLVKAQLDAQRERIAEAESNAERRQREEAGEQPLFDDDGQPTGGPVAVGDVLDDVIDLADGAEADRAWRDDRRAQLEDWSKETLTTELTDVYGIDPPSKATKAELVDLVLDAETNA